MISQHNDAYSPSSTLKTKEIFASRKAESKMNKIFNEFRWNFLRSTQYAIKQVERSKMLISNLIQRIDFFHCVTPAKIYWILELFYWSSLQMDSCTIQNYAIRWILTVFYYSKKRYEQRKQLHLAKRLVSNKFDFQWINL